MRVFINADGSHRPYTSEENAEQDTLDALDAEQAARLDDLAARVARIEAHLWPPPDAPATPDDPAITDWQGVWSDGGLLRDGGTVWRNVSGVPLTTPPSGFPGQPSQWSHLFVVALAPEPEPPAGDDGQPTWMIGIAYQPGDRVTHDGKTWEAKIAHTSHEGWVPSAATHTVWTDIGPTLPNTQPLPKV